MAAKLIAQNAVAAVYDGGVFNGVGPTYGSALPVTTLAKTVRVRDRQNTVDARGWGDSKRQSIPTFGENTVDLELMVAVTGVTPIVVGHYGKVVLTLGTGITDITYEGIWVDNSLDLTLDNVQMQNASLECDAAS